MKIEILESAWEDLRSACAFYERRREGLGEYFLDSLCADIDSLMLFAGRHPVHFKKYHRLLSRRFPFAVYYRVEGDRVRVYAVLDCRQDPKRAKCRLV